MKGVIFCMQQDPELVRIVLNAPGNWSEQDKLYSV